MLEPEDSRPSTQDEPTVRWSGVCRMSKDALTGIQQRLDALPKHNDEDEDKVN